MKSVQIPYELFVDLVLYHLNGEDDFDEEIRQGLEQKLDEDVISRNNLWHFFSGNRGKNRNRDDAR